jgi:hypothetical protein
MEAIQVWLLAHYQVLRDFAGPVATIFAACVAVFVTWWIGRGQLRIARQQAKIAAQQTDLAAIRVRHDLYERCFAVFECARDLIFHTEANRNVKNEHYREYVRGTLNAAFLVDEPLLDYLEQLRRNANRMNFLNGEFQRLEVGEERTKRNEEIENLMNWFGEQYPILVERFKPLLKLTVEQQKAQYIAPHHSPRSSLALIATRQQHCEKTQS